MKLPELPKPNVEAYHFTKAQMLQFQADTIDAVLRTAFEKANLFGQTGEVMWISIKSAVRHEQKQLGETK